MRPAVPESTPADELVLAHSGHLLQFWSLAYDGTFRPAPQSGELSRPFPRARSCPRAPTSGPRRDTQDLLGRLRSPGRPRAGDSSAGEPVARTAPPLSWAIRAIRSGRAARSSALLRQPANVKRNLAGVSSKAPVPAPAIGLITALGVMSRTRMRNVPGSSPAATGVNDFDVFGASPSRRSWGPRRGEPPAARGASP